MDIKRNGKYEWSYNYLKNQKDNSKTFHRKDIMST